MKPIEALIYILVKRFASEFVPAHLRNEFDVAEEEAKRTLASDLLMADWVEQGSFTISVAGQAQVWCYQATQTQLVPSTVI